MSALCDLIEDSCLIIWTSANISGEWLPSKGKWEWGEFRSDRPPYLWLLEQSTTYERETVAVWGHLWKAQVSRICHLASTSGHHAL